MADILIDRVDITLEVDASGSEAEFARLFTKHVSRWHEELEHRRRTERFLEEERNLPDVSGSFA